MKLKLIKKIKKNSRKLFHKKLNHYTLVKTLSLIRRRYSFGWVKIGWFEISWLDVISNKIIINAILIIISIIVSDDIIRY